MYQDVRTLHTCLREWGALCCKTVSIHREIGYTCIIFSYQHSSRVPRPHTQLMQAPTGFIITEKAPRPVSAALSEPDF